MSFELPYSINLVAFPHSLVNLPRFVLHFPIPMHHVFFDHALVFTPVLKDDNPNLMENKLLPFELEFPDDFYGARVKPYDPPHFLILAARIYFLNSEGVIS